MRIRFAIGLPNVGIFGDVSVLRDLAVEADRAGWDGVFVWDHLLFREPGWPVADPIVAVSAIAASTTTCRLGVMVTALGRRRPWKVAKEMATLDRLSGGRLVFGAGLGSEPREWSAFGEDDDPVVRAARLDEGLEILSRAWTGEPFRSTGAYYQVDAPAMLPPPLQRPRIPVWVGGRWPNRRPFRRAARWDGVMPTHADYGLGTTMPPEELAEIVGLVTDERADAGPFDVALEGATRPDDERELERLSAYEQAGLTWWIEALGWWRGDVEACRERVVAGPPALPT